MTENVWREISDGQEAWDHFDDRFDFRADCFEREKPAIRIPEGAVVVDLGPLSSPSMARNCSGRAAVEASALRSFVWLAENEDLIALDWQHPSYLYSPAKWALSDLEPEIPVFPNGDYYIHMTQDMRWGTFGHPWQQTLTIWGEELVNSLGVELLTWLPRHPQSNFP